MRWPVLLLAGVALAQQTPKQPQPAPWPMPVRGIHVSAPRPDEVALCVRFIEDALTKEGANLIVIEFGYRYRFTKRPEVADANALSREDVKAIVAACRKAGVRLIPQINLLGHQSWSKNTHALLRAHPEFDETPGRYADNQGIYSRSYCPLNPDVHAVVFDLIDELTEVCESDAFHAGMDEVFLIGEPECPRCRGKLKADLFGAEVRAIRDHLAKSGRALWMWGDRFLDGATTGVGRWEGSLNDTSPAVRQVPKDIVICDWHYEKAVPTAAWFASEGFQVVSSPWRRPEVALAQLELMRAIRRDANPQIASRMMGMLQTTWTGLGPFVRAYYGEDASNKNALEAARCFRELFRELRKNPAPVAPASSAQAGSSRRSSQSSTAARPRPAFHESGAR